jgi:hypothetical protein
MKEKTLVQKWVDAMKATRGKYIAWMRNVSMREVIGYDIGAISKCAMCKLSTELTGHIVIDGYCKVCPVAVGNGTAKCVGSCCYPYGKLTFKKVKIRKRYYDSILAAVKAEKCIDFNRLCEIVLEVEAKFKNELIDEITSAIESGTLNVNKED